MKKYFCLLFILLLSGCASPYSKNFIDYSRQMSASSVIFSRGEPDAYSSTDLDADVIRLEEDGYVVCGVSSFEGPGDIEEARKQAKKAGSFVVLVQTNEERTRAIYWVKVRHFVLGIFVRELTPEEKLEYGIDGGVAIRSVAKKSPAHEAGMKKGDIIIMMGEDEIADRNSYREALQKYQTKKIKIVLLREGEEKTVTVRINSVI